MDGSEKPLTSDEEPLVRVAGLHALSYCERLYYFEEVEGMRLADDSVYAGRALHEELGAGESDAKGKVMPLSPQIITCNSVGRFRKVIKRHAPTTTGA